MPIEKFAPRYTFTEDRLAQLKDLVPEAFADGNINWNTLKEALGEYLEEDGADAEHFGLTWPGKRQARKLAALPSKGGLTPCPEEGIDAENSEHVFIEGDNLEVLKLMQKAYAGRVKLIYIDPPYNTGNDFVYKDDYSEPLSDYLRKTGQKGDSGELLTSNPKSNGRFHSDWLNMMYSRLMVAKRLLRSDGLLMVSIDDNEHSTIKLMLDELFGQENFCSIFVWNTEGNTDNQYQVKVNHEYIITYYKDNSFADQAIGRVIDPNTREDSNLWKGFADNNINKNNPENPPSIVELPSGFPCAEEQLFYKRKNVDALFFEKTKKEGFISDQIRDLYNIENKSGLPVKLDDMVVENYRLVKPCRIYVGMANKNKLLEFIENGCREIEDNGSPLSFYINSNAAIRYHRKQAQPRNILSVLRNLGTTERTKSELKRMGIYYDYPKPVTLIKYLIDIGASEKDAIVLDFFAGSCTTAHALLEKNKEDSGNRRYIVIQIPERLDPDKKSQRLAAELCDKMGKPRTLAEISKERLRRCIITTKEQSLMFSGSFGFKVFKLAPSQFRAWDDVRTQDLQQLQLAFESTESPLIERWDADTLFYEILLQEGFPLHSRQQSLDGTEQKVWVVTEEEIEHRLFVCLADRLTPKNLVALTNALKDNDILVCFDRALTDETKAQLLDHIRLRVL